MRFVPALAVVVAALALYATRGVLDQIVTSDGLVRVALLPPWQSLGGFLAIGVLGLLWLDRRAVPRGSTTAVRPPLGPALLPVFGLLLLLLPYLPVLPDVVPALQVLAGPIRSIVWIVVLGQLAWVLWRLRLLRADWLQHASGRQLAMATIVATALLAGGAALRLTNTAVYPSGDEPHYLVIAQSLWRDGDLKIENNHTRGDYREYFSRDLEPHYLTRGVDNEIYSIHPIGMPVLMAPVFGLGGYPAVVGAMVLIAAAAAGVMWYALFRTTNSAGAATFGWAAVVATAPFLFNAFAVYPEIPAALAVAVAFSLATIAPIPGLTRWLTIGIACAALPWLSTKYAPMSAALVAIALTRIIAPRLLLTGASGADAARPDDNEALAPFASRHPLAPVTAASAVVVPYGLSLLGWFYFFLATWGSPLPQSPYGALVQTELKNLVFGGPGLLFDQEYGLLPYAPVYLLVASGLWAMWKGNRTTRRLAVEIVLVFAALLGTVGAFRIWWGGSAAPGRPLTSALLLLAVPMAFAFRAALPGSGRRAAQLTLFYASIAIAAILLFAEQGFLTTNGRDGVSALLEYLSPRWPLWTTVPSFIHHEAFTALLHSGVWLALIALTVMMIGRLRDGHPGQVAVVAGAIMAGAGLVALLLMPLLPLQPPWPSADVRARGRLPLLEEFDSVARPLAVEYSPLRADLSADVVGRASLELQPGARKEPQPTRVLHNGRFSLPAGSYRIEVEWGGTRDGETIGLQIGRTGSVWQSWPVDPRAGERWSTEFSLPLDASFVGLRGTPELERLVQHVRVIPTAIVDASRRPRTLEVLGASRSGGATVYFYDGNIFQEERGFWVRGTRRARVAVHRANGGGPLILRVHSGPVANQLQLTGFGWARQISLQPNRPQEVEIPVGANGLTSLELAAAHAFVPRDIDAGSSDPRPLGIWVEVLQ